MSSIACEFVAFNLNLLECVQWIGIDCNLLSELQPIRLICHRLKMGPRRPTTCRDNKLQGIPNCKRFQSMLCNEDKIVKRVHEV